MKRINKTETLYEILNNKTFSINVYQREYRWGRKQIEQMINDLFDCFFSYYYNSSFKHDDTSEVAQYGFYFMGSIIRTGDDSTREIIDGQQLLESYKSGSLTLEMLKSQGVKSNFQGPTIASGTLLELLKKLN